MRRWLRHGAFVACFGVSEWFMRRAEQLDETDAGRKIANPFAPVSFNSTTGASTVIRFRSRSAS
jgi:hypothetical protein